MQTPNALSSWARVSALATVLFGSGFMARAATITVSDDFSGTGVLDSNNWNQNTAYVQAGSGEAYNAASPGMAYYKNLNLGTSAFTVTADSRNELENTYAGVVFNVQDAFNYYVFRWRVQSEGSWDNNLQILRITDGNIADGFGVIVADLTVNTPYRTITISGDGLGNFSVAMTNANPFTLTWTDTTYSGGSAGLYNGGLGTAWFDGFSATYTVPEPASLALLALGGFTLFYRRR